MTLMEISQICSQSNEMKSVIQTHNQLSCERHNSDRHLLNFTEVVGCFTSSIYIRAVRLEG